MKPKKEANQIISAYLQAGTIPDRIFINMKQSGTEISGHELRRMIRVASNRMMRERVVGQ
jgi:hypothetical protein